MAHSPIATFTALPVGSIISGSMVYSSGWRRKTRQVSFFFLSRKQTHTVCVETPKSYCNSRKFRFFAFFRRVLTWHPGVDGFRHWPRDAAKREGYSAGVNPAFATVHPGHPQLSVTLVYIVIHSILDEVTTLRQEKEMQKKKKKNQDVSSRNELMKSYSYVSIGYMIKYCITYQ